MSACAPCLRRTALIGLLSAPIATALADRRAVRGVFALSDEDLVEAVGGSRKDEARALLESFDAGAARSRIGSAGLAAMCRHRAAYPEQLSALDDPPAVLHSTAPLERLAGVCAGPLVAVVGSRRASAYGLEVARSLARGVAAAGVTVVSGLALGIDAAAHRGALDAGAPTLAVLGCGADRPYPRTNRGLYERVRDAGAVVSELPPGQAPSRWTFPARNRIMAGLAQVIVVVEAAERSGSLITAAFASDLGRDVGAVPGRVTSHVAAGANKLIHDGVHAIRGPDDVLDLVFGAGGWERPRAASLEETLDPALRQVLRAVENGEALRDASAGGALPAAEMRAALGRLELLGLVRRDGLGSYERAGTR